IEEPDLLSLPREKSDDPAFIFRNRDLAFVQDHIGDKPLVVFDGVQHRQKGQQPERSRIDIPDCVPIAWGTTTQCETHCGQLSSERFKPRPRTRANQEDKGGVQRKALASVAASRAGSRSSARGIPSRCPPNAALPPLSLLCLSD